MGLFGNPQYQYAPYLDRYEREVNHGHRSAIKKILEGDASPSSLVVLCISAIRSNCDPNMETSSGAENSNAAKVELTDGW